LPAKQGIFKAKTWKDLPETLEPGVAYDIDGVVIRPRERLTRDEAAALVRGIKQMVGSE